MSSTSAVVPILRYSATSATLESESPSCIRWRTRKRRSSGARRSDEGDEQIFEQVAGLEERAIFGGGHEADEPPDGRALLGEAEDVAVVEGARAADDGARHQEGQHRPALAAEGQPEGQRRAQPERAEEEALEGPQRAGDAAHHADIVVFEVARQREQPGLAAEHQHEGEPQEQRQEDQPGSPGRRGPR